MQCGINLDPFGTAAHVCAQHVLFRKGDNRGYMLSKKLLIPQQGVLNPYPPLQSVPLTPDGHLTSQAVKAETSPLLHNQSLLHRPTQILR